ncbi:MAG TPA: carboxypeptidase-like regulatory domain-containing protein, partial [Rhodothermales bacterium]|nr:carboxypeptidase-like regulatory domain-containing protein [Rhodothermales bacterium]
MLASVALAPVALGQTIRGQVVEKNTQSPLPGANVVVLATDPMLGTTTDEEGWFVLQQVPLGRHDLQVSFIGYEPVILPEVLVTAGKDVVLTVALREQIVEGEEVVVTPDVRKDQPLNDLAFVSARSFSVEETRRYAGGVDDPARMASAFAGITTGAG